MNTSNVSSEINRVQCCTQGPAERGRADRQKKPRGLHGLLNQPGQLIIDLMIDFDTCSKPRTRTVKCKLPKIKKGVCIEGIPALVDTGANTAAPLLLGYEFVQGRLSAETLSELMIPNKDGLIGANGKKDIDIIGHLSVIINIQGNYAKDTVSYCLRCDAALLSPMSTELILSAELLLQMGATLNYPTKKREAYLEMGRDKFAWYTTTELQYLR